MPLIRLPKDRNNMLPTEKSSKVSGNRNENIKQLFCANCGLHNDSIVHMIAVDVKTKTPRKVNPGKPSNEKKVVLDVNTALSSIYKLEYLEKFAPEGDDIFKNNEPMAICKSCAAILMSLYKLLQEFDQLRAIDSILQQKILKLDSRLDKILQNGLKEEPDSDEDVFLSEPDQTSQDSVKSVGRTHGPWVVLERLRQQDIPVKSRQTYDDDDWEQYDNTDRDYDPLVDYYESEEEKTTSKQKSRVKVKSHPTDSSSHAKGNIRAPPRKKLKSTKPSISSQKLTESPIRFRCTQCNMMFSTKDQLDCHTIIHNTESTLQCDHCPGIPPIFPTHQELVDHFGSAHPGIPVPTISVQVSSHVNENVEKKSRGYTCKVCSQYFNSWNPFAKHKKIHPEYGVAMSPSEETIKPVRHPFCCKVCSAEFHSWNPFAKHKKTHPDYPVVIRPLVKPVAPRNISCKVCGLQFKSWNPFAKHKQIHIQDPISCPTPRCKKKFSTDEEVQNHLGKCPWTKPPCKICGMFVGGTIKKHMLSHAQETPLTCPHSDCGQIFIGKRRLWQHEKIFHPDAMTYHCSQCELSFTTKAKRATHVRKVHRTPLPALLCPVCGQYYKSEKILRNHMLIHNNEYPYTCPYCQKGLRYSKNYKEHLLIHTGERPHLCGTCGKSFRQLHQYRRHQQVHNGIKPYVCKICGSSFGDNRPLKRHMLTQHNPYHSREVEAIEVEEEVEVEESDYA